MLPLSITFQPNERIPSFTEKLLVDVAGIPLLSSHPLSPIALLLSLSLLHLGNTFPLLLISGACQGVELKLEAEVLTFGPVVKGGYPKVHKSKQKQTKTNKNKQKQTKTNKNKQKQTKTNKKTKTNKNKQKQTKTNKNKQKQTKTRINKLKEENL